MTVKERHRVAQEKSDIVMTVNGQPVYGGEIPTGPISETEVFALAERVTTSAEVAEAWMARENPRLGNRTPRQAIVDGDGQDAALILRSFMSL